MRALALILPLLLLAALLVFNRDRQAPVLPSATIDPSPRGHQPVDLVWISHDWIEAIPSRGDTPAMTRRETFGLDASPGGTECADANCRACLIDLVFGREF